MKYHSPEDPEIISLRRTTIYTILVLLLTIIIAGAALIFGIIAFSQARATNSDLVVLQSKTQSVLTSSNPPIIDTKNNTLGTVWEFNWDSIATGETSLPTGFNVLTPNNYFLYNMRFDGGSDSSFFFVDTMCTGQAYISAGSSQVGYQGMVIMDPNLKFYTVSTLPATTATSVAVQRTLDATGNCVAVGVNLPPAFIKVSPIANSVLGFANVLFPPFVISVY